MIPHPTLDGMEPAVAASLEAQRSRVDVLLGQGGAATAEQAAALGDLGRLYQGHRLVDAAEACYRAARALDPGRFEWAYYAGVLAARRGDLEAAAETLNAALELRPRDRPAMARLAEVELDRGRLQQAQALYTSVLSLDSSHAAAEYGLGRVAARRESYQEAIEHFDRALRHQPQASVIHYHLGQAYRQLGDLEQANRHLEESGPVKVAMPDPLMSEIGRLATGASTLLVQGNAALREGDLSEAESLYRRAVEADPESLQGRRSLASVLTLLQDGPGAAEQLEAAVGLEGENAQVRSDLGLALTELGRDAEALEHLRRAIELDPGLREARLNLANTLARSGQPAEAEGHYRDLLEIDPNDVLVRSRLGTALAQAGRLEEALVEFQRALESSPGDPQVRFNLSRVHFNLATGHVRRANLDLALRHFLSAVEFDDRVAPAHLSAANILAGTGRYEAALEHFSRGLELEPDNRSAPLGHATALMHLGRFIEARAVLEGAVHRHPDEVPSAHALARLLAAAPELSLRDGLRSLELIAGVLETGTIPAYVETEAMALAEVGRFAEAASRQRAVLVEVRRRGWSEDTERVSRNLALYSDGRACCAESGDALPPGQG